MKRTHYYSYFSGNYCTIKIHLWQIYFDLNVRLIESRLTRVERAAINLPRILALQENLSK